MQNPDNNDRLGQRGLFILVILGLATIASAERARYRLDVVNTWSTTTHPGAFPTDAHFSWLAGGTHSGAADFWEVGELASPGMVQMAETGFTTMLVEEVDAAVAAGTASAPVAWDWWFCPSGTNNSSCGNTTVQFDVDESFPLVTLASMLGPSPDWFVGTDGLSLRDGNDWLPFVQADAVPYDGGTRSANVWALFGPRNNPPEPISLITTASGQLVGPDSLGSFNFTRVTFDCDFNEDFSCDASDLNLLLAEGDLTVGIPPSDPVFDLNSDGTIDEQDLNAWLTDAGYAAGFESAFKRGDANLDGVVDVSDFNMWNGHKFTSTGLWQHGDFNGNGSTDVTDLNLWNANKFTSSDQPQAVPEPSVATGLLFVGLLILRHSKSGKTRRHPKHV